MKPQLIVDVECFRDWFMVATRDAAGKTNTFELFADGASRMQPLTQYLDAHELITFNGWNYDWPLISLALQGADVSRLKRASDAIIKRNLKGWQVVSEMRKVDMVDLFEVAPGMAGLKLYGARLHAPRLQELPLDPDADALPHRETLTRYCLNDLALTMGLYRKLKPQIDLRREMSRTYGTDLRSKSDAQVAEAVIKKLAGAGRAPEIEVGTVYHYRAPRWLPRTALVEEIEVTPFTVGTNGNIVLPKALADKTIQIGEGRYRLGIGGLHSTEKSQAVVPGPGERLLDFDVTSYYPSIILNEGYAPAHIGKFSQVYRGIVEQRIAAKKAGDKVRADALKITINGSFGKFGSKYSALYSPQLLIQTTVTGQLALLWLIEGLEQYGHRVVSANTDGIVVLEKPLMHGAGEFVDKWGERTGFTTECTLYAALYSRDVNNYIAVKPSGEVKLKGVFAPPGLSKNPQAEVCAEAVINHLTLGIPVEDSIRACRDVRKFVTVRQVTGGARQCGERIGKLVRFYYARDWQHDIRYCSNGYLVPRTEGAKPLMVLPDALPEDLNFDWYIKEASSMLEEVGCEVQDAEIAGVHTEVPASTDARAEGEACAHS